MTATETTITTNATTIVNNNDIASADTNETPTPTPSLSSAATSPTADITTNTTNTTTPTSTKSSLPCIRIITTGGSMDKTYCGKVSDFIVGEPTIPHILSIANVTNKTATFVLEEICRKDSLELTNEDRTAIFNSIQNCSETKIIITHGTDTMWKTAATIQKLAIQQHKTVVCMGAMQPAAFLHTSDATFNVGFALCSVMLLPPGAHVTMNGQIFSNPLRIYKDYDLNLFYEGDQDRDINE